MAIDKKEIFYFDGYYKNTFRFIGKETGNVLLFEAYYYSSINKETTIEWVLKQDCRKIYLNGEQITSDS